MTITDRYRFASVCAGLRFRRAGFTLIELLVAISIIAVLIAILLPALGKARDSGEAAVCLSNQRQTTTAVLAYAVEHQDALPGAGNLSSGPPSGPNSQASWFFSLEDYVDTDISDIARCPEDQSERWETQDHANGLKRVVSYASNFYLAGVLTGFENYRSLRLLRNPSKTNFMSELAESGSYATSDHIHAELWLTNPPQRAAEQVELDQHNGISHWSYLDGHAAPAPLDEVYRIGPDSTFGNIDWIANRFNPKVAR